jgi:hypothetical protein
MTFRAAIVIVCLAGCPHLVFAGQAGVGQPDSDPNSGLAKGSVEAAGILGQTLPITLFRAHTDRHITMGSVQVGRVMTGRIGPGPLAGRFELLLEATPLMVVRQSEAIFGLAISPLHLRWNFAPVGSRPLGVFAEINGGLLHTSRPVPVGTTTFNFIEQAGFGLRLESGARQAVLIGYRFQHISNDGRANTNPGANFNFFYAGVAFLR